MRGQVQHISKLPGQAAGDPSRRGLPTCKTMQSPSAVFGENTTTKQQNKLQADSGTQLNTKGDFRLIPHGACCPATLRRLPGLILWRLPRLTPFFIPLLRRKYPPRWKPKTTVAATTTKISRTIRMNSKGKKRVLLHLFLLLLLLVVVLLLSLALVLPGEEEEEEKEEEEGRKRWYHHP